MVAIVRLIASLGIFFIMICWEYFSPRRAQQISRKQRWPVNLGLAVFNMTVMRLTVGGVAYLSAVAAAKNSWGLLNWFAAPEWLSIIFTLLFLDFAIYCQHKLFDNIPWGAVRVLEHARARIKQHNLHHK